MLTDSLLISARSQGSRSELPRRYDHRNPPSLVQGCFPIEEEEKLPAAAAAAAAETTGSRDQVVVHRRRAGQDPEATGPAPSLQHLQQ